MVYTGAWKKKALKIIIYFVLVLLALVIIVIPQMVSDRKVPHRLARYPTDYKYILIWNQPKRYNKTMFFKNEDFIPGQRMFIQQKCAHYNCYFTYSKNILNHDEDFDAVVFNVHDVKRLDVDNLNLTRDSNQLYIFRSTEPVEKYALCNPDLDDFFNLTWTYKLNSDIPQPLFRVYDEKNVMVGPSLGMQWIQKMKHKGQFKPALRSKNKAVAWIVNKCKQKTKHKDFINELRHELKGYNYTVDEFGRCGENKCPTVSKCSKLVEKKYYFQLVIEDYFVDEYITDQIVVAMTHLTIPIVLGAGDYRK